MTVGGVKLSATGSAIDLSGPAEMCVHCGGPFSGKQVAERIILNVRSRGLRLCWLV